MRVDSSSKLGYYSREIFVDSHTSFKFSVHWRHVKSNLSVLLEKTKRPTIAKPGLIANDVNFPVSVLECG